MGELDDDDEDSTRPPHRLVPLTVVCSHSAAALPWEVLLVKAQNSAPVVRSLALLSLCAQAYSSTLCTILPDSFAKSSNALATELTLARGVVGPQWVSSFVAPIFLIILSDKLRNQTIL